jgi:hypothetical protein
LRQPLTERYRERLAGVLSCYDRIIVTGTLPGACYAINGLMAEGGSAARSLNCNSPTDLAQREDGLCPFAFSMSIKELLC